MPSDYPKLPTSSHGTASREYLLPIASSPEAPGAARRFVMSHAGALPADLVWDATLLATELVTNALRYGEPGILLRLHIGSHGLGVEVQDCGADLPRHLAPLPDETQDHGRGLILLDALCTSWGVTPAETPPGKTVWCELGDAG